METFARAWRLAVRETYAARGEAVPEMAVKKINASVDDIIR